MTATPRGPNFLMVIEVRAEPREEILVPSHEGLPLEFDTVTPRKLALRLNAHDMRGIASQRPDDLLAALVLAIESAYNGVVHNQRPWGM